MRMVSDGPIGVMLSGGLDSSSILASLHHQKYNDMQTFTIGFKEKEHNKAHLAKMMAEQFNNEFKNKLLEDQSLYEQLINATYFQDEPVVHLSEPHLLALSQMAKPAVQVLLSGENANDLMGGYTRYKALQDPSLLHVITLLGNLDLFSKKPLHNKLLRFAQIQKKSDLVLFNGSNHCCPIKKKPN